MALGVSEGSLKDDLDGLGERARKAAEALGVLAQKASQTRAGAAPAAGPPAGGKPPAVPGKPTAAAPGGGGGGDGPGFAGMPGGAGAALAMVGGPAGMVMGAANQLVDAVRGMVNELLSIPDKIAPFVKAFNPTLVEQFGVAMDNLHATVGASLEPVMETFLSLVRQTNDVFGPLFERLRPMFEQVWSELGQQLLPVIRLLAEAVEAVIPIWQLLVDAFGPLRDVIPLVANLMRAWLAVLTGLLDGLLGDTSGVKDAAAELSDSMKRATRAVILFAANLAAMLGFDKVVENLKKTFSPVQQGAGKVAAPKDVGISDMASILRDAQVAAAQAQGGAAKTQEDWLGDIHAALEEALANQDAFNAGFVASVQRVFEALGFPGLVTDVRDIRAAVATVGRVKEIPQAVRGQFRNLRIPLPTDFLPDSLNPFR